MRKGLVGGVALGVILVIALVIVSMCTVKVPAGYVAVQYNMNGGIKDETLSQGWHLISPTTKTTLYTVGLEQSYLTSGSNGDSKSDESFSASSSEGKAVQIDLTFTYQYEAEKVPMIFSKFKGQSGKEVRDSFIKPNTISWTKEVIAKYKVADIIGSERSNINSEISDYLAKKFEPYGIIITNASLIDINVDKSTMEAIDKKIKSQQDAERQAIENQTAIDKAEADAKVKKTEAQAEADAKLIEAEAEAQAELVKADAEAEANKKISESLTNILIENNKINKWNGKLPTVSSDNASTVVIPSDMSK